MSQKIKPVESKPHIAWVKRQDCCHCHQRGPCDPHHLTGYGQGGTGTKAGDNFAVPLHRTCHREFHDGLKGPDRDSWIIAQIAWLESTQAKAHAEGITWTQRTI